MRDLSATELEAAQKKQLIDALYKIVLTSGATTHTYEKDRILDIKHTEEAFSHKATVVLDNSDGVLTDLDLEGYQGVISYGMITKAGEEYSATAPLTVLAQELDSSPGQLTCTLELIGIPNMLAEDRASENYTPASDDTKTVKDIINDMFDGTMTAYDHCKTYTVDWDSEDDLIDAYTPKDGFRIYKGGTRLAALRQLIDYTKCVAIFDADGHITIKEPTTTGATYDYEYSLEDTYHNFFAKATRKRLVIPNKIQVDTDPDAETPYSGSAVDAASYAALGRYITQFETAHLDDDDQGDDIAEAMLLKYQLNAEMGAATVPMNVGAEVFDYVKVNALNAQDVYRIGNIGKIVRHVNAKKGIWEMRFSFGGWLSVRQRINELETYPSGIGSAGQYFSRLSAKDAYIENLQADNILLLTLDEIDEGETYQRVLATHLSAGQIVLNEEISYSSGYDPTDKLDKTDDSLDDVPDGTTYTRLLATQISAGKINLTDTAVFQSGYDPTDKLDKTDDSLDDVPEGTTYQRVLATQISAGKIELTSTDFLINENHIESQVGKVELSKEGLIMTGSSESDCGFELNYLDATYLLAYWNDYYERATLATYSDADFLLQATGLGDLLLESVNYDVKLSSGGNIKLLDDTIADDIDAEADTKDIGATTEFDEIHCVTLYYNGGSLPDEYDDLELIRQMKNGRSGLDMATVPDFLKLNKAHYLAKAEMKAEQKKQRIAERLQAEGNRLDEVLAELKAGRNPRRYLPIKATRDKITEKLNMLEIEKQDYLKRAEQNYERKAKQAISVNGLTLLLAGGMKRAIAKIDELTERIETLESR